ncbi:hypothetical protein KCU61_g3425, partial [Aureobasidium melanogenum]
MPPKGSRRSARILAQQQDDSSSAEEEPIVVARPSVPGASDPSAPNPPAPLTGAPLAGAPLAGAPIASAPIASAPNPPLAPVAPPAIPTVAPHGTGNLPVAPAATSHSTSYPQVLITGPRPAPAPFYPATPPGAVTSVAAAHSPAHDDESSEPAQPVVHAPASTAGSTQDSSPPAAASRPAVMSPSAAALLSTPIAFPPSSQLAGTPGAPSGTADDLSTPIRFVPSSQLAGTPVAPGSSLAAPSSELPDAQSNLGEASHVTPVVQTSGSPAASSSNRSDAQSNLDEASQATPVVQTSGPPTSIAPTGPRRSARQLAIEAARQATRQAAPPGEPDDSSSSSDDEPNNDHNAGSDFDAGDDDVVGDEDIEADNEQAPDTSSEPPAKRKPKTALAGQIVQDGRDLRTMNHEFERVKDEFDISQDPSLIYADKLRLFLEDSKLLRAVAPYKRAEPAKLLEDFLQQPVVPAEKSWRWRIRKASDQASIKNGWGVSFHYGTRRGGFNVGATIPYAIIPEDEPNAEDDIQELGDTVLDMIRRLPYPRFDSFFLEGLIRVAAHVVHHAPKLLHLPFWQNGRMLATVRHVLPADGKVVTSDIQLTPSRVANIKLDDIPDVENKCTWRIMSNRAGEHVEREARDDGSMYTPSAIPDDARDEYGTENIQKLEKFMRFAAYELTDRIVDSNGMKEMWHTLLSNTGIHVRQPRGIYGGSSLFYSTVYPAQRLVLYFFGTRPRQDISAGGDPGTIGGVRTLDGVLASIPLEVGKNHFLTSGDPRIASLYLAQAADMVNWQDMEQQRESASYFCDNHMAMTVTHYCQACLGERVCNSLVSYKNARVCKGCKVRRDGTGSSDTTEKIMTASVTINHELECRALGKDPHSDDEQRRLADMLETVLKNCRTNNRWCDQYTSQERELSGVSDVRVHRDPFLCSIDAVEPYGLSHDETMRVHTANNVAMTTSGYNYIKQRQLVGFLVELSKYESLSTHPPAVKQAFLDICRGLYLVRLKMPYTKKARTQGKGLSDLRADQAEWRSGRPVEDEDGPWKNLAWRWSLEGSNSTVCYWDDETVERLSKLSDEIQANFGVQLQKADDGAPWIADKDGEQMPPDWGWAAWSQIMTQRHKRMRIVCNRHWLTIDSSEGLFAEFIYQICCPDEEYAEFLRLPRTIWIHHPCCVSVAHKVHGKPMATGWPRKPSSLSERDNTKNNILFETWSSNVLKMDMELQSCLDLRRDLKKVKLYRPELYDPSKTPASEGFRKRTEKINELLTADDFAANSTVMSIQVNDDAGKEEPTLDPTLGDDGAAEEYVEGENIEGEEIDVEDEGEEMDVEDEGEEMDVEDEGEDD